VARRTDREEDDGKRGEGIEGWGRRERRGEIHNFTLLLLLLVLFLVIVVIVVVIEKKKKKKRVFI